MLSITTRISSAN